MRRTKNHISRLRLRAAEILNVNFPHLNVRPEDIVPASGAWRTCIYLDVYRWEVFTTNKAGLPVSLGCWNTLTEFVQEAAKIGCYENDGVIYIGKILDSTKEGE